MLERIRLKGNTMQYGIQRRTRYNNIYPSVTDLYEKEGVKIAYDLNEKD